MKVISIFIICAVLAGILFDLDVMPHLAFSLSAISCLALGAELLNYLNSGAAGPYKLLVVHFDFLGFLKV